MRSRNVLVAGAGIGGLTVALALAAKGFRVTVLEKAPRLEETGAGIQLTPNATHILLGLGLEGLLRPDAVVPEAISIRKARNGAEIARVPLGASAAERFGAPYWVIHRADLQAALLEAVRGNPDIALNFGCEVVDFAAHAHGVTILARRDRAIDNERGIALICADGLWSPLRKVLGNRTPPRFARRSAWRAVIPAHAAAPDLREPMIHLWLGHNAHLVHYPVKGGSLINVVAIMRDGRENQGWSAAGERADLLQRFSRWSWSAGARALLGTADRWLTWSLYDGPPLRHWGAGPVTLLGDAAHAALPFLAQGAAMAIEDAAVLADCMAHNPNDPAAAMRRYEAIRRPRTARAQNAARKNASLYHMGWPQAAARNMVMRGQSGDSLLRRYGWIYGWRPPVEPHINREASNRE